MVARRSMPWVVALALAFAPSALEACQASCLEHFVDAAALASGNRHHADSLSAPGMPAGHVHHHAAGAPTSPPSAMIAGQSHLCDFGDDLPVFSAAGNSNVVGPAVLVSTFEFPGNDARSRRVPESVARRSSERIVLATQLRI
jgi:hypothetical protein